ncbi:MAG TPA: hypothetical protein VJ785_01120 [Anaerolineales bacterium]|nr:hypothetical protein [Anaerolineales bacterium]
MKKVLGNMAGIIFTVFCLAVLGLLMSFTLGALRKLFPDSFSNQMWGLVLFDIAAMVWALVFVFKSQSTPQYAIAAIGFVTAFAGTLLMVTAEVMLSGQTFVQNNDIGRWMVYGFIIVTAVHAVLIYAHHASSPEIREQIDVGIARGEIVTEAINQATHQLDREKAQLAHVIHSGIVDQVKRDLNIPIAVDPNVGFVPVGEYRQNEEIVTVGAGKLEKRPSLWSKWREKFSRKQPPAPVVYEQTVAPAEPIAITEADKEPPTTTDLGQTYHDLTFSKPEKPPEEDKPNSGIFRPE